MKKNMTFLQFIAVFVSLIAIASCSKSTDSGKSQTTDGKNQTEQSVIKGNINMFIQTTFFDTSFGATREEVISNFKKRGLILDQKLSNNVFLSFSPIRGESFSFGNMSWKHLNVRLKNNKFYSIQFYNSHKEKFSAESNYYDILSALKSKYNMIEEPPADTEIYKLQRGVDGNGHVVCVYFKKGESIGHEIWHYSNLLYADINIQNEPSDEL